MIVVVGEALIDVVIDADGDPTETPGGSPLNVAVGLVRLEVPTTLISQVGHDERGGLVVQHVTSSGAEFVAVPTSTGRTSVATARLDESGAASYDFDLEWSLPRRELPPCRALHVGSLGTLLEPGRESVLDLVEQAGARDVFVSYDANLRESFIDDRARVRRQVLDLGRRCGLVKLSDEDALLIDPAADPDDVARTLLGGDRTQLVVLTRGAGGATAFTAEGETTRPAAPGRDGGHGRRRGRLHVRSAGSALRPRRVPAARPRRPRGQGGHRPGCCGARWRWLRSRVNDAERVHLVDRSCRQVGPPELLVAQRREHVVHHDRVDRHAAVAGAHLDVLRRRVETGPPVDDAVTLAVDRGEGEVGVERDLALLPAEAGALTAEAVSAHHPAEPGTRQPAEQLGVPGEDLVDGARRQHRAAHADDALDQVGAPRGEAAGEHAAEAVADDRDLAVAPGRDRLQPLLEAFGRLPGAAAR